MRRLCLILLLLIAFTHWFMVSILPSYQLLFPSFPYDWQVLLCVILTSQALALQNINTMTDHIYFPYSLVSTTTQQWLLRYFYSCPIILVKFILVHRYFYDLTLQLRVAYLFIFPLLTVTMYLTQCSFFHPLISSYPPGITFLFLPLLGSSQYLFSHLYSH